MEYVSTFFPFCGDSCGSCVKFTVNENSQRFLNEEVEKVYHMHDGSFSVAVDRMEEKESLL